jgi:hypothetical protein
MTVRRGCGDRRGDRAGPVDGVAGAAAQRVAAAAAVPGVPDAHPGSGAGAGWHSSPCRALNWDMAAGRSSALVVDLESTSCSVVILVGLPDVGQRAEQPARHWSEAPDSGRRTQSDDMHRLADRSAVLARGPLPLAQWGLLSSVA